MPLVTVYTFFVNSPSCESVVLILTGRDRTGHGPNIISLIGKTHLNYAFTTVYSDVMNDDGDESQKTDLAEKND